MGQKYYLSVATIQKSYIFTDAILSHIETSTDTLQLIGCVALRLAYKVNSLILTPSLARGKTRLWHFFLGSHVGRDMQIIYYKRFRKMWTGHSLNFRLENDGSHFLWYSKATLVLSQPTPRLLRPHEII